MQSRYCKITFDEFEDFAAANEYECENPHEKRKFNAMEYVYERYLDDDFKIVIFSSVQIITKQSRDKGEDAIRILPFIKFNGEFRPIAKGKRIYRLANWKMHLKKESDYLVDCFDQMKSQPCKNCGSKMTLRSKGAAFYLSCTAFPKCKTYVGIPPRKR